MKNIRGVRWGGGVREPQRGSAQLIKYDSEILATVEKISEGDRSIRGRQLKKYQRATEVSESDRSIRGRQLKKYQKATEVSEGDRSIRGRQLKKISEGGRQMVKEVSEGDS